METPTASTRIASFAFGVDPAALPRGEIPVIATAIADTVAVAVAGRGEQPALLALAYARSLGTGDASASVWGSAEPLSLEAAAFYNGIAAHALDYDDVSVAARGHVSVCLVPTLLALAEAERADPVRLMSAYHVGFEVACKLGRWLGYPMQQQGWHPTSVIGAIAAAAAAGHLLCLDEHQVQQAVSLACVQAGGTQESFGTMAKAFHVGVAVVAAIRAVKLARAGFTASATSLEGRYGVARLYAHAAPIGDELEGLGRGVPELLASGVETKKYPNCFATHHSVDAILALRRAHGFGAAQVRSVRVRTSAGGMRPLIDRLPVTGLEAKFSLQYAVALALCDGAIRLSSFDDAGVRRPDVGALMKRIDAAEEQGAPDPLYAKVTVWLADGRVVGLAYPPSDRRRELIPRVQLKAKVVDCFAWGGSGGDAQKFLSGVFALPAGAISAVLASTHRTTDLFV